MNNFRKLLVLGINELLDRKMIDLSGKEDTNGVIDATIAGRPSKILWTGIGSEEVRVSVWWDYDHSKHPQAEMTGNRRENFQTSAPLAKAASYPKFVGALASGWLERKEGKYLQGRDKRGIFDSYIRRSTADVLDDLPAPTPKGYAAEGRMH